MDIDIEEDVDIEEELCDECGESEDDCSCINCCNCGDKVQYSSYDLCTVCEDSHSGCCECCSDCGMSYCECCESCGGATSSCGCGDSFGDSSVAGWERRGVNASAYSSTSNWQEIWPEIDSDNFDLCQEAADFYLLEAITNGLVNSDNPFFSTVKRVTPEQLLILIGATDDQIVSKLDANRKDRITDKPETKINPLHEVLSDTIATAKELFEQRIEKADTIFRAYFHMAVAGEARHHRALKNRILNADRDRAWSGWRSIYDQVGPEALIDLADLFMEFEGGSYGGTPWANACKILHSREMGTLGPNEFLNKKMFIDRAWTLEHNGGCFLNKISWGVTNPAGWNMGDLKVRILNSHASNPPRYKMLLKAASTEVVNLWDQVWEINNELNGTNNENPRNVNVEKRLLCRSCNSNPLVGHYAGCSAMSYPGYKNNPIPSVTAGSNWYMIIEEEDWDNWNWHAWTFTEQNKFFGPDFKITNPDLKIELSVAPVITMVIEHKEDPTKTWHSTYYAYHSDTIILTQEEAKAYEADAVAICKDHLEKASDTAVVEFNNAYGGYSTNYKKEDLRIIFTQANIGHSSTLHKSGKVFQLTDPFNQKKPVTFKPIPEDILV